MIPKVASGFRKNHARTIKCALNTPYACPRDGLPPAAPRLGARAGRAELGLTGRRDLLEVLAQTGFDLGRVGDLGSAELEGVAHAGRALLGGALCGGGLSQQGTGGDKNCIADGTFDRNHLSAPMNARIVGLPKVATGYHRRCRTSERFSWYSQRSSAPICCWPMSFCLSSAAYEHQKKLEACRCDCDGDGIPGDAINVGFVGAKKDILCAMRAAAGIRPIRSR